MTDDANVRDQRPDETPLQPERAVRLLRAKAAELEQQVRNDHILGKPFVTKLTEVVADIALVATLLADEIERADGGGEP